jgi:ComF family protein
MIEKIKIAILDTLCPIYCLFCQADNFWICEKCFSRINILENQVCPYCEKVFSPGGKVCSSCKMSFLKKNTRPPLDSLVSAAKYKGEVSKLVHLFKYNFVEDLRVPLGKIMTKSFLRNEMKIPDLIIPVPLHHRRLRWRGFNQSKMLAEYLSENLTPGFPIEINSEQIVRKKNTTSQMKITDYQKRQENLKNAFGMNPKVPNILKNKHILLVDDVCTTGATLFECARLLKANGAKKVSAIVLARQEMK